MGLGFSHGGAHWSYSSFNEFRQRVCQSVGINLYEIRGFFTKAERKEGFETQNWPEKRPWEEIDDPIVPLMNHSDCDGVMTPEECAQVAPRLREIVESWPGVDLLERYDKENGLKLVCGMEECAEKDVSLQFC